MSLITNLIAKNKSGNVDDEIPRRSVNFVRRLSLFDGSVSAAAPPLDDNADTPSSSRSGSMSFSGSSRTSPTAERLHLTLPGMANMSPKMLTTMLSDKERSTIAAAVSDPSLPPLASTQAIGALLTSMGLRHIEQVELESFLVQLEPPYFINPDRQKLLLLPEFTAAKYDEAKALETSDLHPLDSAQNVDDWTPSTTPRNDGGRRFVPIVDRIAQAAYQAAVPMTVNQLQQLVALLKHDHSATLRYADTVRRQHKSVYAAANAFIGKSSNDLTSEDEDEDDALDELELRELFVSFGGHRDGSGTVSVSELAKELLRVLRPKAVDSDDDDDAMLLLNSPSETEFSEGSSRGLPRTNSVTASPLLGFTPSFRRQGSPSASPSFRHESDGEASMSRSLTRLDSAVFGQRRESENVLGPPTGSTTIPSKDSEAATTLKRHVSAMGRAASALDYAQQRRSMLMEQTDEIMPSRQLHRTPSKAQVRFREASSLDPAEARRRGRKATFHDESPIKRAPSAELISRGAMMDQRVAECLDEALTVARARTRNKPYLGLNDFAVFLGSFGEIAHTYKATDFADVSSKTPLEKDILRQPVASINAQAPKILTANDRKKTLKSAKERYRRTSHAFRDVAKLVKTTIQSRNRVNSLREQVQQADAVDRIVKRHKAKMRRATTSEVKTAFEYDGVKNISVLLPSGESLPAGRKPSFKKVFKTGQPPALVLREEERTERLMSEHREALDAEIARRTEAVDRAMENYRRLPQASDRSEAKSPKAGGKKDANVAEERREEAFVRLIAHESEKKNRDKTNPKLTDRQRARRVRLYAQSVERQTPVRCLQQQRAASREQEQALLSQDAIHVTLLCEEGPPLATQLDVADTRSFPAFFSAVEDTLTPHINAHRRLQRERGESSTPSKRPASRSSVPRTPSPSPWKPLHRPATPSSVGKGKRGPNTPKPSDGPIRVVDVFVEVKGQRGSFLPLTALSELVEGVRLRVVLG